MTETELDQKQPIEEQHVCLTPEQYLQDNQSRVYLATQCSERLVDPSWLTRHQRYLMATTMVNTIQGQNTLPEAYSDLIEIPYKTYEQRRAIEKIQHQFRRRGKKDTLPFQLKTDYPSKKNKGIRIELTEPPPENAEIPDENTTLEAIREIRDQLRSLIELDQTLPEEDGTFHIDPSLPVRTKARKTKIIEQSKRFTEESNRKQFTEENLAILNLLKENTLKDLATTSLGISNTLGISIKEVPHTISKISASLRSKKRNKLTIKSEAVPNHGREMGFYLDIIDEEEEKQETPTLKPAIVEQSLEERTTLIKILKHIKAHKVQPRKDSLQTTVLESLIQAAETNQSTTAPYCQHIHEGQNETTIIGFERSILEFRDSSEEKYGIQIIRKNNCWQPVLPKDSTKYAKFLEEIEEKQTQPPIEIPKLSKKEKAKLTKRILEEGQRHICTLGKNKEGLAKFLEFLLSKTLEGELTTMTEIFETIGKFGVNKDNIRQWIMTIERINEETQSDKHPSILGFQILRDEQNRIATVPTKNFKKTKANYHFNTPVWPISVEVKIEFSRPVYDMLMRTLKTIYEDAFQVKAMQEYAYQAERGKSISLGYIAAKFDQPKESATTQISARRRQLTKMDIGLDFVPSKQKTYFMEMNIEKAIERIAKHAVMPLKKDMRRIETRLRRLKAKNTLKNGDILEAERIETLLESATKIAELLQETIQQDYSTEEAIKQAIANTHRIMNRNITIAKRALNALIIKIKRRKPVRISNQKPFKINLLEELIRKYPPLDDQEIKITRLINLHARVAESGLAISLEYANERLKTETPYTTEDIHEAKEWLKAHEIPLEFKVETTKSKAPLRYVEMNEEAITTKLAEIKREEVEARRKRIQQLDKESNEEVKEIEIPMNLDAWDELAQDLGIN